jgi:hypothetical protein
MRRPLRTATLTLLLAALAPAAAGCGGSEVAADEVPGNPPALVVPTDSELGAAGSNADAGADSSADADADTGTADSGAAATATPAPADSSGGTAAPEATTVPEDTTTDQTEEPAAPEPSFCEQNEGAC